LLLLATLQKRNHLEQPLNVFALDVETTISSKGDPFDTRNSMVLGAIGTDTSYNRFLIASDLQQQLSRAKMVILFNAKFDLHWIRNLGCSFSIRLPIWDCQLAEFILSNQRWKYPSLDEACSRRLLPRKLDVVKSEYWDRGLDTTSVPFEVLDEYLKQDISCTYLLYLAQLTEFKKPEHRDKYKIFRMQCYDLLVLEEMEYNGFLFDCKGARDEAIHLETECNKLDNLILTEFPNVPINLASPDHISCMLYGGSIVTQVPIPIGVFKTGSRTGQIKYKNVDQIYTLPRLVEPLKGSALAKEGYYGTSEDVLRNLKSIGQVTKIIYYLLERRGIEKLRGTYYNGIPDLIDTHHWGDSIVHGQFNQCVTSTGRLSATKPNQQNMPGGCKRYCISRYND
jgi:DNA polymerase I-like protein with 3'-5' exonuclease and polymerase domains